MKLSKQVKPVTYLKSHAAEMLRGVAEKREPYIITQNGEAKAVLQDIATYEQTQETLALLKILALGTRQIEEGRTESARSVIQGIRKRHGSKR
ncbi:MAG TPA: type II toxin-antitoxin system Phd/YefM family antitoxin [Steroidobacteraceae bacterium]|nr:type II toxin-antitoxin system Phd/YefM family antitoxin [Steroidobacteraceae bacterium]